MAEVNAKDLTTKTAPASTDSMLLFGTSTNEGAKITVDNLANNILERLTTKTFANQVGGSSAATILAQLATLNSNIDAKIYNIATTTSSTITLPPIKTATTGLLVAVSSDQAAIYGLNPVRCNYIAGSTYSAVVFTTDGNRDGQTLTRNSTANVSLLLIST